MRNNAVYPKNSMLEFIDALQLTHKYVYGLIKGKKWPKSPTSTENICCVIDADLCRQICADDNSTVNTAHNHSI